MENKFKKMIAPIVVAILLVLYFALYFGFLLYALEGIWKWLFAIVPMVLAVAVIAVCVERIREINKGEEDDLSQY